MSSHPSIDLHTDPGAYSGVDVYAVAGCLGCLGFAAGFGSLPNLTLVNCPLLALELTRILL